MALPPDQLPAWWNLPKNPRFRIWEVALFLQNKSTGTLHASCLQGFHCSDTSVCHSMHSRLCNMHISRPLQRSLAPKYLMTPTQSQNQLLNFSTLPSWFRSLVNTFGCLCASTQWERTIIQHHVKTCLTVCGCFWHLVGVNLAGSY